MARSRTTVRYSVGAEVAMVRLVRRMSQAATKAAISEISQTWPEISTSAVAEAIRKAAFSGPHLSELMRIAGMMHSAIRRQISALGVDVKLRGDIEKMLVTEWAIETDRSLRALFAGGVADAQIRDGLRSLAQRMASAARGAVESVSAAVSSAGREASRAVRSVISVARSKIVLFGSHANQAIQQAAGIETYVWRSRRDGLVRPRHAELDGTIQRWDTPPVIDTSTGRRGHPGEDYNCRCIAIPVVKPRQPVYASY